MTWGQNFSYPIPPDSIIDRQGRINYMIEHFWNEQSITDSTCFQRPGLLLDYVYLLKQADNNDKYVQSFVSLASKHESTLAPILYWLDNILYDSSSPHYDENLYMKLMKAVIASDVNPVMKLTPRQRVEIMSKNQVGNRANNFSFVTKEGCTNRLYKVEAPLLVLFFNNPDCSMYQEAEDRMMQNEKLQTLITTGKVKILAITPDADSEDWTAHVYPQRWMVGLDSKGTIYKQRLYDIQHLPSIYLLDSEKRVLLKEANVDGLFKWLGI
jgi:hypothetical protein